MEGEMPKSIGSYRILDHVGSGGMANVYRAVDRTETMEVALKVLKPEGISVVEQLKQIGAPWEGEIGLHFSHPGVVQTYEHAEWRSSHYIAMEMLDWASLKDLVTYRSPLLRARRYAMVHKMGQGIAHIHGRGFIHRDICPKNALIDASGDPKIIDFGLTVPCDLGDKAVDKRSGTPSYMAPEQVRAKSFDVRSDLYSFGVTMYEVLTCKHPFRSREKERSMAAHLSVQAPPPSHHDHSIPQAVDAVVLRAMAKEPQDRFQSIGELMAAIEESLPPDGTEPREPHGPGVEARRFARVDDQCFVRLRLGHLMKYLREYRTVTRDLSIDGACCVLLREAVQKGTPVDMDLQLRGDPVVLPIQGKVVWCRQSPDKETYEVGIIFRQVSNAVREKLRSYLDYHQPDVSR